MKIYKRWQEQSLKDALKNSRVVILAGSRQCGKTTLARHILSENITYRTLDDFSQRQFAQLDPDGFLKHSGKTMIIDEIQKVPHLISSIKKIVDEKSKNGQFLITGSSDIQTNPYVKESLAGRTYKIRLRPFSQGELSEKSPDFIKNAFKGIFKPNKNIYSRDDILQIIISGGYPIPFFNNNREKRNWYLNYIDALIENDLKDIANIKRQADLKNILYITAGWSSKYMEKNAILSSLSVTKQTFDSYISILKKMYLVEEVMPYLKTNYEYITKRTKLYMSDTGIMSTLLNLTVDKVRENADIAGKLFETFIYNELVAMSDCFHGDYNIYHYRDKDKREIDFILEDYNENILAVEVKSGVSADIKDFKHIKWFKNNIFKGKKFTGIILYAGKDIISYDKDMYLVPVSCLWA